MAGHHVVRPTNDPHTNSAESTEAKPGDLGFEMHGVRGQLWFIEGKRVRERTVRPCPLDYTCAGRGGAAKLIVSSKNEPKLRRGSCPEVTALDSLENIPDERKYGRHASDDRAAHRNRTELRRSKWATAELRGA